eukprot:2815429-Amphidinium_carterae.1
MSDVRKLNGVLELGFGSVTQLHKGCWMTMRPAAQSDTWKTVSENGGYTACAKLPIRRKPTCQYSTSQNAASRNAKNQ